MGFSQFFRTRPASQDGDQPASGAYFLTNLTVWLFLVGYLVWNGDPAFGALMFLCCAVGAWLLGECGLWFLGREERAVVSPSAARRYRGLVEAVSFVMLVVAALLYSAPPGLLFHAMAGVYGICLITIKLREASNA